MRKFKWYWIGIALLFVIVIVSAIAILKLQKKTQPQTEQTDRPFPSIVQSQFRPLPNQDKYDKKHNIQPLESNLSGSIYSSVAQIQGDVVSWDNDKVVVNTIGEQIKIIIPQKLGIMCFPSVLDGVNTSDGIFLFTKDDRYAGTETTREYVKSFFQPKTNIVLLVDVDNNDGMIAFEVAGLDCTEPE